MFEEYQATVEYVQLDANGKNVMTLVGLDNGEPEQREVLFAPSVIPEVGIFEIQLPNKRCDRSRPGLRTRLTH